MHDDKPRSFKENLRKLVGPVGPELERVLGEMEHRLVALEHALRDLSLGDGTPPGFEPERYLVPGLPRLRPGRSIDIRPQRSGPAGTTIAGASARPLLCGLSVSGL